MNVRPVTLDASDAIELAELLAFLATFLNNHNREIVFALGEFTVWCYSIDELRADLARFAFLLDGSNEQFILGEPE